MQQGFVGLEMGEGSEHAVASLIDPYRGLNEEILDEEILNEESLVRVVFELRWGLLAFTRFM